MALSLSAVFARVGDGNVDDVVRIAAYGWFVVAGLQAVLLIFAAAGGALGGHFLLKTKSRAVAGALLLYGAVTAGLCGAKVLGLTGNGEPLVIAVVALWAGWRGWSGTRFWQRRACAVAAWGHVRAGAALAVVITLATLCIVLIAVTGRQVPAA